MKRNRARTWLTLWVIAVFPLSAVAGEGRGAAFDEGAMVQFGASPVIMAAIGDLCERDSDVVGCTGGMFALGFQADASIRFPFEWFALGLTGGTGFELSGAETCSSDGGCTDIPSVRLWHAAAEARFYPLLRKHVALLLAIEVGVCGAGGRAMTDVAPELGGAIGFDFPIGRYLLIGFDVRARFFAFGSPPPMPPDGGEVQMTNSFVASAAFLKLGARFSLSKKQP